MQEYEIKEAFLEEVQKRSFGRDAQLTKHQVYDYRKRVAPDSKNPLTIGLMLEVLWKLDKIEFKL